MNVKPYFIITRNSVMASLAYRGHFFFSLAGTVIYLVISRFLWKAVYANGGTIGGLTFTRAYLIVGVSMGLFGIMQTGTEWQLHNIVREGDIVRYITKPMDFKLQFFADQLGFSIVNCLTIALPSIVLVYVLSGAGMPPPERILMFLPSVLLGFLINFYLDFITGLSVFITQSIGGISIAKESIVVFLSGAIVPIAFFPEKIRGALEWLPFQALYNTPARILTDASLGADDILFFFLKQTAWLVIFYLLAGLLFSAGLKKLVVNGG